MLLVPFLQWAWYAYCYLCLSYSEPDMPIDVEALPPPTSIAYDIVRAQSVMNECERHVNFARANPDVEEKSDEDWEENVTR